MASEQNLALASFETLTRPLIPCDLVFVGGINPCGKTSLVHAMGHAAECIGPEYVFADFSQDIRKWHLKQENNSPLRQMCWSQKEKYIDKGLMIPDDEVNQLVFYYLHTIERIVINAQNMEVRPEGSTKHTGLKMVCISGWPRTEAQIKLAKTFFKEVKFVLINATEETADRLRQLRAKSGDVRIDDKPDIAQNRIPEFKNKILPVYDDFATSHPEQTIRVEFHESFTRKVKMVIHRTIKSSSARKSMLSKIEPPNREKSTFASRFIAKIESSAKVSGSVPNS